MGVYCTIVFISSLVLNSMHLYVYLKNKRLRTPNNFFHLALTILNLFASCTELPMVMISAFNCRWSLGRVGCALEAFIMYFCGCLSIYILVVASIERFLIFQKPARIKTLTYKQCLKSLILCAVLSLIWASMPLFGWSYYSLEGVKITCSVEWRDRSFNVISYNTTIFLFVFIIPLVILVVTNTKLILFIKKTQKRLENYVVKNRRVKKKLLKQRNLTIVTVFLIAGFLLSWLPYALFSMYSAFVDASAISPLIATIPSLMCKSSLLWPSLFNLAANKNINSVLPCCKKGYGLFVPTIASTRRNIEKTPLRYRQRNNNSSLNGKCVVVV